MKEIEDLILLVLWGIIISLGIVGFMLTSAPAGGVGPTSFESIIFTALKWAVFVAILLIIYQLWRKHKRKEKNRVSVFVPTTQFKQGSMVIRGANWTLTLRITTVLIFLYSVSKFYLFFFPLDPLCNGIYALDIENLSEAKIQCFKSGIIWLTITIAFYSFFFREKHCQILKEGFLFTSALVCGGKLFRIPIFIPWTNVAKVSICLIPRAFKVAELKLIFYPKPGYSFSKHSFQLGYVSQDEINRIKETLAQYVLVEVQKEQ